MKYDIGTKIRLTALNDLDHFWNDTLAMLIKADVEFTIVPQLPQLPGARPDSIDSIRVEYDDKSWGITNKNYIIRLSDDIKYELPEELFTI